MKPLLPILKSGQVKTFDREVELFPGLRTVAAYGHTPGQNLLCSGKQKARSWCFWGDTLHVQDVQFADPSVTVKFDVDPKAAAAQRKTCFSADAREEWIPGGSRPRLLSRCRTMCKKEGDHFRWIPVPYTNDSQRPR